MKNPLSHLSNLQQRLIVGMAGIALFGLFIWVGYPGFFLLFGTILILSLIEFFGISPFGMPKFLKWMGVLGGLFFSWALLEIWDSEKSHFGLISLGILWLLVLISIVFAQWDKPFQNLAWMVLGWFYLVPPWVCMLYIIIHVCCSDQRIVVLGLFSLLWAADSGAYFVGRKWGKTRLFEKVSPKKSWEGLGGGMVCALAVGYGFSNFTEEISLKLWLILAVSTTLFGTLGDLAESTLKRSFDLKDSGNLLPGHGGILDRFDGLFLAAPANYFIILTYSHFFMNHG
jgi:phosphatidate cytidylyltransferase